MKLTNATLITSREGSTVRLYGITPAEALVLVAMNHRNVGKMPLVELNLDKNIPKIVEYQKVDSKGNKYTDKMQGQQEDGFKLALYEKAKSDDSIERSDRQEVNRLMGRYRQDVVKALFPGTMPKLPETFEEALQAGLDANGVGDRMMDGVIATTEI